VPHQPQLADWVVVALCCDSFGGFANLSASYFFFLLTFFLPISFFFCTGVEILYENFVYNNQLRVTPSPTYSASIELTIFLIETHRLPAQLLYFPTDFGGRVELRTKLGVPPASVCVSICVPFIELCTFTSLP